MADTPSYEALVETCDLQRRLIELLLLIDEGVAARLVDCHSTVRLNALLELLTDAYLTTRVTDSLEERVYQAELVLARIVCIPVAVRRRRWPRWLAWLE